MTRFDAKFLGRVCEGCWNTGLVMSGSQLRDCNLCGIKLTPAGARIFEAFNGRPFNADDLHFHVALAIATRRAEQPIARAILQTMFYQTERSIKKVVESLRLQLQLPIGSTRSRDVRGYYWMLNPDDYNDWAGPYLRQAISSLVLLRRMQRRNFPALAGQTNLDFVDLIATELREAL